MKQSYPDIPGLDNIPSALSIYVDNSLGRTKVFEQELMQMFCDKLKIPV